MPSSPEECTATPSWKVSQTAAAFTQARMPPQNVVSSRITSTAVERTLAASCSKLTTTVLVASGTRTISRVRRMPLRPSKRLRGVLARLFFILVEEDVDPAAQLAGKLPQLRGCQMRTQGAGGIGKPSLPQHRQVK